jgi:hypothetical protein
MLYSSLIVMEPGGFPSVVLWATAAPRNPHVGLDKLLSRPPLRQPSLPLAKVDSRSGGFGSGEPAGSSFNASSKVVSVPATKSPMMVSWATFPITESNTSRVTPKVKVAGVRSSV